MGKSTPTAPDPTTVAQAQTQSNEQTAQYQQQLNMINASSPYGSVSYDPSSAPGGFTETTTLSPQEQSLFNQATSAESGALGVANTQLGNVESALNTQVNPTSYGALQYGAQGGPIQGQVNPASMGDPAIGQAQNAAYNTETQYLGPQFQQQQEALQSNLAAEGLNPNDAAYQNAMTLFGNQQNQAYQGAMSAAVGAGDTEQQTLFGQNLSAGEFANSAEGQLYGQNVQNAGLNNTAQQQAFQQGAYAQELPINEMSALLGMGQVTSPTGVSYTPSSVASTNVEQAYQNSFQDQMAAYNANNMMGGLFGLGSAALNAGASSPSSSSVSPYVYDFATMGA